MPQDPQESIRQILRKYLNQPVPLRVRISKAYRIGIIITAMIMPLFPLAYAAAITAVGGWALRDIPERIDWFNTTYGLLGIPLWALTLVACIALIILMIKPFLCGHPRQKDSIILEKETEPVLESFIRSICNNVNAPFPEEIILTENADCRMEIKPGLFSIFRTHTRLYLGLPVFAALSLSDVTGLLTRKIGLYSRGSALRLRLIILIIDRWLERTSKCKDSWDMRLEAKAKKAKGLRKINIWITQLCIWICRRLIWLLRTIGQWTSFPVMRHRTYDADEYACHTIGTDHYITLLDREACLAKAREKTIAYYRKNHNSGTLPSDYPAMVQFHYERLSITEKKEALNAAARKRSHPSRKVRLKRMKQAPSDGFFSSNKPAKELFINLEEVSEELTQYSLQSILGKPPGPVSLKPNRNLLALDLQREASLRFVESFLGSSFNFTIRWTLDKRSASNLSLRRDDTQFFDLEEWKEMLKEEVEKAQQDLNHNIPVIDMEITRVWQFQALLDVRWNDYAQTLNDNKPVTEEALQKKLHDLEEQRLQKVRSLFNLQRTLSLFLNELAREYIRRKVPQQRKDHFRNLWYILVAQNNQGDFYRKCRHKQSALQWLIHRLHEMEEKELPFEIGYPLRYARGLEKDLEELTIHFGGLIYPFDNSKTTVRAYLTERPENNEDEINGIYHYAESCLNRFFTLYNRVAASMLQASFDDPYPPTPEGKDTPPPPPTPSAPNRPKLKL